MLGDDLDSCLGLSHSLSGLWDVALGYPSPTTNRGKSGKQVTSLLYGARNKKLFRLLFRLTVRTSFSSLMMHELEWTKELD